jgi:glycine/serine hydroxymethyltransferase
MKEADMERIANWMKQALDAYDKPAVLETLRAEVEEFCLQFPLPSDKS